MCILIVLQILLILQNVFCWIAKTPKIYGHWIFENILGRCQDCVVQICLWNSNLLDVAIFLGVSWIFENGGPQLSKTTSSQPSFWVH